MKKIVVYPPHNFAIKHLARLKYTLNILNQFPLNRAQSEWSIAKKVDSIAAADIHIFYGRDNPLEEANSYTLPVENEAVFSAVKPLCCNAYTFATSTIYDVNTKSQGVTSFLQEQQFAFDVFTTIFYHLSRFEEFYANEKDWDKYDMLQEKKQLLVQAGLEQIPVVDHLIVTFFQVLHIPITVSMTTYQLSHDIDTIRQFPSFYKYLRASARQLILQFNLKKWWQLTLLYFKVATQQVSDPHDTFTWLLVDNQEVTAYADTQSKDLSIFKSFRNRVTQKTIYFLAGGKTRYEGFYKIDDPHVKQIIQLAKERSYHIGLHPSYKTWRDGKMLGHEKQNLERVAGQEIHFSRQHFLHFDLKTTPNVLIANGITEDSTLGYQNRIGFRCGTGFRYPLYDFKNEKVYPLWVTPLVVMDVALLTQTQQNINEWKSLLLKFLEKNKSGTQITFNFHNSSFGTLDDNDEQLKASYLALFSTNPITFSTGYD